MNRKFFVLFVLAVLLVTTSGTALAQGTLPPADNDHSGFLSKPELLQAASAVNRVSDTLAVEDEPASLVGSIVNGNFEQGSVGWMQSSSNGWVLILNQADLGVTPHSASWAVWLGGDVFEQSTLSQSGVAISNPVSSLNLWYWISSQDICTKDYGYVMVNNTDTVYTWDLCGVTNTGGWKNITVDLSAYNGQTVTITITAVTDGTGNSNLYIDDVSLGGSFVDVPTTHPFFTDIQTLYLNGLTGGCGTNPMRYCPDQIMDRGQAAVFMLRGKFGSSFAPGPVIHVFQDDWSKGTWAEPWADAMYTNGMSAGCLASPPKYCPWVEMPREQAVIFALRMKYGTDYVPPAATGTLFADMTNVNFFATPWAEQAYIDGLIPACGTSGGKPMICPKELVSRGLGAYMIVRAKNLTLP